MIGHFLCWLGIHLYRDTILSGDKYWSCLRCADRARAKRMAGA